MEDNIKGKVMLVKAKNFIGDIIPKYAGISLITNSWEMPVFTGMI